MSYRSKAEEQSASWMTWGEILVHVQKTENCQETEARRQIANAIADRALPVRWADERKIPIGSSPLQVLSDEPPRDAEYWRECVSDPDDPNCVRAPRPYDAALVDKRKPLFDRKQALKLWPSVLLSAPSDPAHAGAGSGNVFPIGDARRRGPKADTGSRVKESMRDDLRKGQLTVEKLASMKEVELEARYGASRDTCRKAREDVLSESKFVDNSPNGNSDK
jgi:hypothetical protein